MKRTKMKIDALPEPTFRLLVSLFLARQDAISFQQKVIAANDDARMARKALGTQKADRIAMKHLQTLSGIAKEQVNSAMTANQGLITVLERLID